MKSKGNIVFLGMMGSGKTSIGSLISKKLKVDFFDTDQSIEKNLNTSITKIFQEKGEKFFREFEQKITLQILKNKNIVVALGGGTFLNKKIRDEIISNHSSFWLNWDAKTLINRINKNKTRPLTANLSNIEINDLILNRSKIYSKANFEIHCNNHTKNEIVKKILHLYENN